MPVTINPSKKRLTKLGQLQTRQRVKESRYLLVRQKTEETAANGRFTAENEKLLQAFLSKKYGYDEVVEERCGAVIQSSFQYAGQSESTCAVQEVDRKVLDLAVATVTPASSRNGLVGSVLTAYNGHHHLVLRPDDVWIAILTQLSFYANAEGRADELRQCFVSHEGEEELEIQTTDDLDTLKLGDIAQSFAGLLEKRVRDPSLRDWMIPNFMTTTTTDKEVASVIMMATLKSYFKYRISMGCGLPVVTLLGDKQDWEN